MIVVGTQTFTLKKVVCNSIYYDEINITFPINIPVIEYVKKQIAFRDQLMSHRNKFIADKFGCVAEVLTSSGNTNIKIK